MRGWGGGGGVKLLQHIVKAEKSCRCYILEYGNCFLFYFFEMFMDYCRPKYHSCYLLMGRENSATFFFYTVKLIFEIMLKYTRLFLRFFSCDCDKILWQNTLREVRCITAHRRACRRRAEARSLCSFLSHYQEKRARVSWSPHLASSVHLLKPRPLLRR